MQVHCFMFGKSWLTWPIKTFKGNYLMQYWQAQFNYFNYVFVVMWCNHLKDDQHVPFTFSQHKTTIIEDLIVSPNTHYFFSPSPQTCKWVSILDFFANLLNLFFLSRVERRTFFPLAKHNSIFFICKAHICHVIFHIFLNIHHINNYMSSMNVCPLYWYHYDASMSALKSSILTYHFHMCLFLCPLYHSCRVHAPLLHLPTLFMFGLHFPRVWKYPQPPHNIINLQFIHEFVGWLQLFCLV